MLTLCTALSVHAGDWSELFTKTLNAVPYTFIAANAGYMITKHWSDGLNAWLHYRNGQKINSVQDDLTTFRGEVKKANSRIFHTTEQTLQSVYNVQDTVGQLSDDVRIIDFNLRNQGRTLDKVSTDMTLIGNTVGTKIDQIDKKIVNLQHQMDEGFVEQRNILENIAAQLQVLIQKPVTQYTSSSSTIRPIEHKHQSGSIVGYKDKSTGAISRYPIVGGVALGDFSVSQGSSSTEMSAYARTNYHNEELPE